MEVYLDGGVFTGTDVFKALALGAKNVFVGRPALWGLTVGGQEGVQRMLDILRTELDYTLQIAGNFIVLFVSGWVTADNPRPRNSTLKKVFRITYSRKFHANRPIRRPYNKKW